MRKLAAGLIYALGVLALAFIIYVSTFYFILNRVVRPYENERLFETHSIRPVYNVIYYPMRWFVANGSSFKSRSNKEYFGTLRAPSVRRENELDMRSAQIEPLAGGWVLIGFTGKRALLNAFDQIEYGTYVRLEFGVALGKNNDRFINRLISFEVIDLMDDPRIEDEEFSEEGAAAILTAFDSLIGDRKICADKFVSEYENLVFEHCSQARYAQNIGGGCYHVVGYSVTTTVLKRALEQCGQQID